MMYCIKLNKAFLLCLFLLLLNNTEAQDFPQKNYPKNYFGWPLKLKPDIVANFGELRPNHYHMGLDCRTDAKVNQIVVAAADGYITRVTIEPFGFGRCIVINHPNGYSTLYAHLNNFNPALEKYVTAQQYKLQSWKVDLKIPEGMFPVKKGEFISYSGSTGGSQGPHTHFEIRETKTDKVLNPMLFGMPIPDNVPPTILRLYVYDRNISVYEQNPHLFPLKKINGSYTSVPSMITSHSDRISFAISTFDSKTGSHNPNGIYQAVLYEDGVPISGFQLNDITYDETRYVNAHIDYKLRSNGGPFAEHLSRLPGNPEGIYKDFNGDGVITFADYNIHHFKVEVKDADGNTSVLKFDARLSDDFKSTNKPITVAHDENEFLPGYLNVFENEEFGITLPENVLYDSVRFEYQVTKAVNENSASDVVKILRSDIPSQAYFPVKIRTFAGDKFKNKIVMHRYWGTKNDYVKADCDKGWCVANFREFGFFQLLVDTVPPVISLINFRDGMNCSRLGSLLIRVTDNNKEIKNFRAELDGKWLRFTNDKAGAFIYNFDEHCPPGNHLLKITAEDLVGNVAEKTVRFSR